jgi:acyl-coenzyme A synthetase/AMP-(fatty) acid ligase
MGQMWLELIEYCREHLATYKKPKEVIFVPSLPKTPTGKILKRELETQFGLGTRT